MNVSQAVARVYAQALSDLAEHHGTLARVVDDLQAIRDLFDGDRVFREFFGYHKASTVFKDVEKFTQVDGFKQFHSHSPFRMMYDTDTLILAAHFPSPTAGRIVSNGDRCKFEPLED